MVSGPLLQDITARLSLDAINIVTPIHTSVSLPDSTEKYILQTKRTSLVLIISNALSPRLVKRGTEMQRKAKAQLSGFASDPIELPILEGFAGGRSFAVWTKRQPLSSNRLFSKIQRTLIAPKIYRWLREIASQASPVAHGVEFVSNLGRLQQISGLPLSIGAAVENVREEVRTGAFVPLQVIQHTDLWPGNILRTSSQPGFIIIDWASAKIDGTPFFDLTNYSLSIGASKAKLRREVALHSAVLGCESRHALGYLLAGFGCLSSEREYFSESRLLEMCDRNFHALQAALQT